MLLSGAKWFVIINPVGSSHSHFLVIAISLVISLLSSRARAAGFVLFPAPALPRGFWGFGVRFCLLLFRASKG